MFIALIALGSSCAQISQPVAEVAPQGTSDGIQVHGHWTVTVTNPDGTVGAVHEFENALSSIHARDVLTGLLAGETAVDGENWQLQLMYQLGADQFGEDFKCTGDSENDGVFTSIDASSTRNTLIYGSPLMLTATCPVQTTVQEALITWVSSRVTLVDGIWGHGNPDDGFSRAFIDSGITLTSHSLELSPVRVAHGQSVTFNIMISFE